MTSLRHPWWLGMPEVETEVDCQGQRHRLRWVEGELVAIDHADPAGERLLVALGGEAIGCLEVITTWDEHSRDVRLLATGPRSAEDRLDFPRASLAEVGRHIAEIAANQNKRWPVLAAERLAAQAVRSGAAGQQQKPFAFRSLGIVAGVMGAGEAGWRRQVGLLELYTLRRPFIDRLQLEVWAARADVLREAASHGAGEAYRRERPVLLASAIARVRGSVLAWLGVGYTERQPEVSVELSGDDAPFRILSSTAPAGVAGEVSVTVGSDWVPAVFGRQLAVVDGHLVSELLDLTATSARVRAYPAPWAGSVPVELGLVRSSSRDGWELG